MIKRFKQNEYGRDFVVGDIHGCFSRLQDGLSSLGFNIETDRLFSVGDLVDRGSESKLSLDWLAYPWFYAVCGNHEDMAIGVSAGEWDTGNYRANGGAWFLSISDDLQKVYAKVFSELPVAIEVETKNGLVGIVHADCPVKDWGELQHALTGHNAESYRNLCLWSRDRITNNHIHGVTGVHKVFVGHTPVQTDVMLGNVHYIDTGAVFGKKLTIIEI